MCLSLAASAPVGGSTGDGFRQSAGFGPAAYVLALDERQRHEGRHHRRSGGDGEAGIGGVFLFIIEGRVTESVPVYVEKPIRHLTPEWFAMLRHAAAECKRLGLELSLMNCTGWTTSGGPWVPPEQSMMRIAWSEKYFKGPGRIAGPLPMPPCDYANYQNLTKTYPHIHESVPPEKRFYRDVAVVAYRMDPSAARTAALWPPKLSCSEADQDPGKAVDGDGATAVAVKEKGFRPIRFRRAGRGPRRGVPGRRLRTSGGRRRNQLAQGRGPSRPADMGLSADLPVPKTKARYFRLFYPGGGSVKDMKLSGDSLVQDYQPKASFHGVWRISRRRRNASARPRRPGPRRRSKRRRS